MSDDRIYSELTKEAQDRVLSEFKEYLERGDNFPKLHDSLIGLPQDEFTVTWKGLNAEQTVGLRLPAELTSFAYNGIDAYATALLAAGTLFWLGCVMTASCDFIRNDDDSITLRYSSMTNALIPELFGDRIAQFLRGFVPALAAKNIKPDSPVFCDIVGAPAWFKSPGSMVLNKSSLAKIPEANWPVASRSFTITANLRQAAKNAILLLTASATEA
jgi:hypothetical protein